MKGAAILIISLFILTLAFTACRKPIEQGKLISANGLVFDSVKNKPLPFAKLYLFGANSTFYGIYYSNGPYDSTTADANGNFKFKYIAEGKSVDYGISLGVLNYGGYNYGNNNYVIDIYNPIYKFNYSTNINNAIVKARELNYTKISLKVLSNPYDTFTVRTLAAFDQGISIYGRSIDTTIYVRHLPNTQNIIYYRTESRTRDSFSIRREIRDTFNANLKDTILISKTINSTYSMPKS